MFGTNKVVGFLAVIFVSYLIHFIGVLQKTEEYQEQYSNCEYVKADFDLFGSEDSVLYSKDILIGSHANMHKIFQDNVPLEAVQQGGFYAVYGISTGKFITKRIEIKNYPKEIFFIPHGIYLRSPDHLHAINHSFYSGGERIETYKITLNQSGEVVLEFVHSTQMEPKFNGITNDLVFLTPERFIISDWQVFPIPLKGKKEMPLWQMVGTYLAWIIKLKTTNLWDCKYIQGGVATCSKVRNSQGLMVNGIAFDGKETVAAADSLDRSVKIFKINSQNSELDLVQYLSVDQMADNISYDFISKQFIVGGTNTVFEYIRLNSRISDVQANPTLKSIVPYQGKIHTLRLNPTTKQYESQLLFSSSTTVVGLAGALIDESQNYLFINSFPDKALVVCKKVK